MMGYPRAHKMEVYEITGFPTGVSDSGVNYLQPVDSFQNIVDGFVYRQVLQSRQGIGYFATKLDPSSLPNSPTATRVMGIFEHILPDGTSESLVIDKNYLYKYNTSTGVYDVVPFGGSLAANTTFSISSNEDYVSGVSYPTKTNTGRFVFTGKGMSGVYFYDGSVVKDYINAVDNPDYEAPVIASVTQTLVRAKYVIRFSKRIIFVVPTMTGGDTVKYSQYYLYSAVSDADGNGDKFNSPGAGLEKLDTPQEISGANLLGNYVILNADRSAWSLEQTGDAFDPTYAKQIPGVLGTDADFSSQAWSDIVKSTGKTGILGADTRQNLRIDNKIPNFTEDRIDQPEFQLTYGGFDRSNSQFLWSYLESESDESTQNRILVNNYEFDTWAVFNMRLSVFGQTDLGLNLSWDDIDETAGPASWATWDTTTDIWDKIGLGEAVQKTLAGDDDGFIYEFNSDYNDRSIDITGITQASSAVLTVAESNFSVGDKVVISGVTGMTPINNWVPGNDPSKFQPYLVTAATNTTVTINVDTSNTSDYPSYIDGGLLAKVISFEAETIPFNPYRTEGRRVHISEVEFLIDAQQGAFLRVDVFADEEETPFKENVLCMPTTTTKAREWVTMSVNNEANFMRFKLKQESPSAQLRITSIRIHAQPGGSTSG